jgi:hypothetical protein
MSNPYLAAFNNQFLEFVEDVLRLFPNDTDLLVCKKTLLLAKKMNPKLLITVWRDFIAKPYHKEIEEGGIEYFLNKDYTSDLQTMDESDKIMDVIDRLRTPLKGLHDNDKSTAMTYISNLSKLSMLYS